MGLATLRQNENQKYDIDQLSRRALVWIWIALCTAPLALLFQPLALAQNYLQEPGRPTFTSMEPVELGFVNVANGNLHLEIPLASFPQRGTSPLTFSLVYDSRIWYHYVPLVTAVWSVNSWATSLGV